MGERGLEPDWLPEARRLKAANLSYAKIGERVGTSRNKVYYWLNPPWERKGRTTRSCAHCGDEFSPYDTRQRHCSPACHRAFQAERLKTARPSASTLSSSRRSAANPNYRHGRRIGKHSQEMARRFNLRLKGESCCRNCGRTDNLQLHHALPRSFYRAGRCELLNGLPLCTWCHLGWHRREVAIYRDVFTVAEWAWLSAATPTGQEIGPWLDERYPDRGRAFRDYPLRAAA